MSRRMTLLTAVMVAGLAAACTATVEPDPTPAPDPTAEPTPEPPEVHTAELRTPDDPATVLATDDQVDAAVGASEALFTTAPLAVLAPTDDVTAQLAAASHAVALGVPLLLTDPPSDGDAGAAETEADGGSGDADTTAAEAPGGEAPADGQEPVNAAVAEELTRLQALTVLTVGSVDPAAVPTDVTSVPAPTDLDDLEVALRLDLTQTPVAEGEELAAVVALDRAAPTVLVPAPLPTEDSTEDTTGETDQAGAGDTTEGDSGNSTDEPSAADDEPAAQPRPTLTHDAPAPADDPLPHTTLPQAPEARALAVAGAPTDLAPAATARAAGWDVVVVPGGDPRATSATVQAVTAAQAEHWVAVGSVFGDTGTFAWKTRTAATGVELPGGGQVLFPHRRMVALYGTPSTAALGLLGEQGLEESIERAKSFAAHYRPLTDDVVVPAFEIIVTIASAGAGDDEQYSRRLPAESFVPWIEAARDAGVYVVLDLQPGRTDFLTQAKQYESLLTYPNVGLALDPEWRLKPDQVHLRQIGRVGIDEVNTVVDYLADLTREHALPQKLLVLHQFSLSMITDVDGLDTSRDELALMIHVDGQGSQPAKQDTWRTLRANAPDVPWWGWKNFVDEDSPMLTPQQTYEQVDPVPHLVTYQ